MPVSKYFEALSQEEQAAVDSYVRGEYDRLVSHHPLTYIAQNAQSDPAGWRESLRELVAADPKRVRAILEQRERSG
jgi:hypothetical protein